MCVCAMNHVRVCAIIRGSYMSDDPCTLKVQSRRPSVHIFAHGHHYLSLVMSMCVCAMNHVRGTQCVCTTQDSVCHDSCVCAP